MPAEENNVPQDANLSPNNSSSAPGAGATPPAAPKKTRRRRRWPWVIVAIIVLLIVIVLLLPTIVSTGPVTSFVVSKINQNLNGTLSVSDLSVGWFSGLTLTGVKVDDAHGRRVAEVNRVQVPMSLISAIGGNYDLHDTVIDQPNLVIFDVYPDGTNTLTQLIKEQPGQKKPKSNPKGKSSGKLPDIKGKITINNARGTITLHPAPGQPQIPPVFLDSGNAVISIPDVNSPISDSVKLVYRVGPSAAVGTIDFSGSIDAVQDNQLITDQLMAQLKQGKLPPEFKADQKLQIANANLAPVGSFMKSAGQSIDLDGVMSGAIDLKADGATNTLLADGQFKIANFLLGGAPLKGDIYKSANVALPVHITTAQANGTSIIKIETLNLQTDQAKIELSGQVAQSALSNLAAHNKPGSAGNLSAVISVTDLPGLINPLRDVFGLQKDVSVTGGSFNNRVDLTIMPQQVAIKQSLDATASGTNAGRKIQLDPIHLDTALTALPTGQGMPELHDLALNLTSAFASAKGGGKSIAELNLNGNFDLKKAYDQLAQFKDMGGATLAGTGTFNIASQGDLSAAGGTSRMSANVTLTNVQVQGLKDGKSLDQPRLVLDAAATLKRAAEPTSESSASAPDASTQPGFIQSIPSATLTLQSGDPKSPVLDLAASATNITLGTLGVEKFDVQKLAIPNLAQAQQSFSALVPGQIRAAAGSLSATISGSYLNDTLNFDQKAQIRGLALQKIATGTAPQNLLSGENEDIITAGTIVRGSSAPADATAAQASAPPTKVTLTSLSASSSGNLFDIRKSADEPLVVILKNGAFSGNGQVLLSSNLKRVMDTLQAMSSSPEASPSPAGQLTSGELNATLKLATGDTGSNIHLDGAIDNLGVTTRTQPIQNQKVTLSLSATAPPDMQTLNVSSAIVGSEFAKASVSDMLLNLKAHSLEMLQKAKVQIAVPDLNKTYAVMQAFSPPSTQPSANAQATTQPVPPLQIGGGALVDLDVTSDPATHTIHLSAPQIAASKVSLVRGDRKFEFDKLINLKLAADVGTTNAASSASTEPAQRIDQLHITQLDGDLGGLASLSMPQPIALTNVSGDNVAANGSVGLSGSIEPLTRLLSVLQNSDPMPYRGDYVISQAVATTSGQIKLAGDATINKLIVLGSDNKPAFTEDKLVLADDLVADPSAKSATINNIALTMPSSHAAGLNLKGNIADWENQRTLSNTTLALSYDLEKLWPMVKPLLSPSTQEQLKDLKIAGKFDRTFAVSGSYPANPPAGTKPIKYLKADGSLAVALLDTSGINVQNLELPISLENGQVVTVYANKPKTERTAKPAQFNGGTLDLNSILVDLNGPEPRVSIGKNQQLVKGASINSLLGDTLGKYINPVFTNSKRAKGLLDVTVDSCERVALGDALKSPNSGTAKITFNLSDMDIANPVGQLMLAPIINGISKFTGGGGTGEESQVFEGYIKSGVINLANGKTTQDVTLQLIDPGTASANGAGVNPAAGPAPAPAPGANPNAVYMPMSFKGDVDLATQSLALNLRVPPQLVSKFIPDRDWKKSFDDAFPQGIPGVIRGTTSQPKFDYGNVVAQAVQAIAQRQILKSIPGIGGNKEGNNANQGNQDQNNPLGGLLNQITGHDKDQQPSKKKKKGQ
jgi:hypothetical protein